MVKEMKKGLILVSLIFLLVCIVTMPAQALIDSSLAGNENLLNQERFTYISVFYNEFNITNQGKAELTSSIDARNVDECKVSMYLQKYQNGRWTMIKHWSSTENGTFCGLGEIWYVESGYQYRMVSYGYVYINGICVENTYYISDPYVY
jgi:hypothetical protein